MAEGQPARIDTVDLVLDAGRWLTGRPPERWGATDLAALSWYGLLRWCRACEIELPDDAAPALRLVARHLDDEAPRGLAEAVATIVGAARPGRPRAARSA